MNSYQIRYYLKLINLPVHTGVYAMDQLKFISKKSFAIVFNNMKSTSSGMHWCCLVKKPNQKYIDFFDSLGMPIEFYDKELLLFVKRIGGCVNYYTNNIQSFSNITCGQHCCYFITKRFQGYSFKQLISMYNKDPEINDEYVKKIISKVKFPKFTKCLKKCLKDPFANICFQKSKKCYHFKQ